MCKNWIEVGTCRYANKCQFAHGDRELVEKNAPTNNKYKSKECTTFNDKLFCPYGKRCLFKHEDRSLDKVKVFNYYWKVNYSPEQYLKSIANEIEKNQVDGKRLDIFKKITSG
jgi:hypothetical protein